MDQRNVLRIVRLDARLRGSFGALICALVCTVAPASASAQDEDRIWGRVQVASGEVFEGFLRWDRNEGSWVDILDGTKELPGENYLAWLEANESERATRYVELAGHRVSWEEEHPDFPRWSRSGIRFGHISSIEVVGRNRVELTLRSGEKRELRGGTSDLGPGLRRLVVDVPGEDEVSLRWSQLERVDFSAAPAGVGAKSRRLHGTVLDERGRTFTGYVSWDLDEILETDVLDGEESSTGYDREIPFTDIASIEKYRRGSRVTLKSGETVDLEDSNDVDDDNNGIQISDPALGLVQFEWGEFVSLAFHEPEAPFGYDAFDGGQLLTGTVVTTEGEEIEGVLRWDADEQASWEMLNGWDDATFAIELAQIISIQRDEGFGSIVTLLDGRTFELFDEDDVDLDNRGVMVSPPGVDHSDSDAWRVVKWDDLAEVRFRRGG